MSREALAKLLAMSEKERSTNYCIRDIPWRSERPYRCPICGSGYATVEEMLECMNQSIERGPFKVGDIVMLSGKWTSGPPESNDPWLACIIPADFKNPDHFRRCHQLWRWYVITSLWDEKHRELASVFSLFGDQIDAGWNPTVTATHCCMWKDGEIADWPHTKGWPDEFKGITIRPPDAVMRQEAAALVAKGFVATTLI